MIKEIVQVWDPMLFEIAKEVESLKDLETIDCIQDLKDTLENTWRGVWLAAPQIGRSLRIFIIHPRPTSNYPTQKDEWKIIIINPKIIARSEEVVVWYEWCLSISSQNWEWMMRAKVPRYKWVQAMYTNEWWEYITRHFEWFASIIFQHEYDHLDWILFLERVEDWKSLRSDR